MKFVGAIIENPKYGFLLQQRDEKASSYPLCWTLFGGKVEEGEKPKAALFRELKEEINLTQRLITSCKKVQRNIQNADAVQYIYYVQTKARISELSLKEGKQMQYLNRSNLFDRKFAFNIGKVLRSFFDNNQ